MPLFSVGGAGSASAGRWLSPVNTTVTTDSTAGVAGRVYLSQFTVPTACDIDGLCYIVVTSSGNVTGGIVGPIAVEDDSPDGAAVVAQSASTAVGSVGAQVLTWTPVLVQPGIYYTCLEFDNGTVEYGFTGNHGAPGLERRYDRGGGYGALTDPVPVTASNSVPPRVRIRVAS